MKSKRTLLIATPLVLWFGLVCKVVWADEGMDPVHAATALHWFFKYAQDGSGYLLGPDQKLITTTGKEKSVLQDAILVKSGVLFSTALRAWALISDNDFVYRPQCGLPDWLRDHIKTGLFTYPRKIRFPKGLLPIYRAHMFNIYLFDPLGKPYEILLNKNYISGDLGKADVSFAPGRVVYLRIGNDESGDPRGFVLIIFGPTEDTPLHPLTFPKSRAAVKALSGEIPKGAIYVDAILPEEVKPLEDQATPSLSAIYRALNWPTNPLWDQDPSFTLDTKNRAIEITTPMNDLVVTLRSKNDPEPTCALQNATVEPYMAGAERGPEVSSDGRELEVSVKVNIPGFAGDVLVDWGDGEYSSVHPGDTVSHLHTYASIYLLQFLAIDKDSLAASLAFPVAHGVNVGCKFYPAPVFPIRLDYSLPEGIPPSAGNAIFNWREKYRMWDMFFSDYWFPMLLGEPLPEIPGRDVWSELAVLDPLPVDPAPPPPGPQMTLP